ncbi:MAG: zinc ABC transporter substrate-binding protein [Dehalococcoidia bacterium]
MRRPRGLVVALLVGALATVSCAAPAERAPGALRIVATTTILGEFTRDVAGPDARVSVLIPPGADPHSFEAPTSAARDVAAADVLVVNGHRLEVGCSRSSRRTGPRARV